MEHICTPGINAIRNNEGQMVKRALSTLSVNIRIRTTASRWRPFRYYEFFDEDTVARCCRKLGNFSVLNLLGVGSGLP